jgi:hypothetical protein
VPLHQALEEFVAEQEALLAAVERLSEAEQFDRRIEGGDERADGGVEGFGRVDGERDCFLLEPRLECGVIRFHLPDSGW